MVQDRTKLINGKVHGIYSVISNKTVREKEKHKVNYKKFTKDSLGMLCKTGRGYFIDGFHVDMKAVEIWKTAQICPENPNGELIPFVKKPLYKK